MRGQRWKATRRSLAAVAAATVSKSVVGSALLADAQTRHYTDLFELAGDRGIAATFTAPSTVTCGSGEIFWNHLQQMIGNHGDGNVVEWMETGVGYCRYGSATVLLASCMIPSGGSGCTYSESDIPSPAPPGEGGTMAFKITNSNANASWETWEAYAGGGFIGNRRDFTPGGTFAGNWNQVGLEAIGMAIPSFQSNALMDAVKYRDQGTTWHAYGLISGCSDEPPANGSPFFGAPDSFVYNFGGGAGTC